MNLFKSSIALFAIISTVNTLKITELRVKVGEILEKLNYPSGRLEFINNFGDDAIFNAAVDFSKKSKPTLVQMSFIPKDSDKISPVNFDLDYKESTSKATISINLKKLPPGLMKTGTEYTLKLFVAEDDNMPISWELGTFKTPNVVDYKLPEIEDHFYKMPEIYTPEIDIPEGKKNPLYTLIGLVMIILLPWLSFIKMWKNSGSDFSIPKFLSDNSKSKAFPFFSASLLCLVVLIVSAWVYLSIFQTLGFLAILSTTAFIFGHISFKNVVKVSEVSKND